MKKLGLLRRGAPDSRTTPPVERAMPSPAERAGERAAVPTLVSAQGVASFRWERRLITILGAALTGSKEAGPFQLAPAMEHLIGKLRSFGARIEELTPDRIVAVFGFEPIEDAPRLAAHAALAMLKALERLEDSSNQQLTGRFAIHVCRCLIAQSDDVVGM